MRTTRAMRCVLTTLLALGPSAWAQDRIFLDRSLQETPGELVAIDQDTITIRSGSQIQRTPREQWIAMVTPGQAWARVDPRRIVLAEGGDAFALNNRLDLTDGQRLFGRLVTRDAEDEGSESLNWTIPGIGTFEVLLERVRSIVLVSSSQKEASPGSEGDDLVVTINGDRLAGFVESIGQSLELDRASGLITLPWSVVREVHLANPPAPAIGVAAWLTDASVVALSDPRVDASGRLLASIALDAKGSPGDTPDQPQISVPAFVVRALAFDPGHIVPLARLDAPSVEPLESRLWAPTAQISDPSLAQLGAGDIRLSGPVRCTWTLPERASRLGGTAILPRDARLWGDYELIFLGGSSSAQPIELARIHLDAQHTRVPFNIELDTSHSTILIVEIHSGNFGPIQDSVILRRALLLLEN